MMIWKTKQYKTSKETMNIVANSDDIRIKAINVNHVVDSSYI